MFGIKQKGEQLYLAKSKGSLVLTRSDNRDMIKYPTKRKAQQFIRSASSKHGGYIKELFDVVDLSDV